MEAVARVKGPFPSQRIHWISRLGQTEKLQWMAGLLQPDSQWDPMWGRLCSPSAMSMGWERQHVVSLVKITSMMAWNLGMLEVQEVEDLEWKGSVYSDSTASWFFLGLKLLCHLRGEAKFRRVKEKNIYKTLPGLLEQSIRTRATDCITVLEAWSLKSRCQQDRAPSETCRESFLASSSCYYLLTVFAVSWLTEGCVIPFSASIVTQPSSPCVSLSLCLSTSYKN